MGCIVRDRIDTSATILGEKLPFPILVSPMGSHGMVHPEDEAATARGMAKSGALLCVSSASTIPLEENARASAGPKWFQMDQDNDEGPSREILQRAPDAGFKAIILTVDAIGQGTSGQYADMSRPRPWLPYGNYPEGKVPSFKANLSWRELERVRSITGLPVVIKGADAGGGRQRPSRSSRGSRTLCRAPCRSSSIAAYAGGADVAKALALGANAVAVGRPVWWALGGAGGIFGLMEYFQRELVESMLHLGVDKIASLGREHIMPLNRRITMESN
jgi:lactate oxidase